MKRIILVHGWSGTPELNWFPWLKSELEKLGHEVLVPAMPDTDNPTIDAWVSHLSEVVGDVTADTYFVGHSIGCQTILRYLETINIPVGGAVFVAGWVNLEEMEDDEEVIARPWLDTPIDIEKVKSVLPKSTLIISDDDPWFAFEENRKWFSKFVTNEIVLHDADHIDAPRHPEILSEITKILE